MDRLDRLFQQFLRERTYINNVTDSPRRVVRVRLESVQRSLASGPERALSPHLIGKADLQRFVVHLGERDVKPVKERAAVGFRLRR